MSCLYLFICMNFNEKVYSKLKLIPEGKVTTYKEIAKAIGNPKAFRAAGNACNKNPEAPRVPCHRVVSSNGSIGGYAFGLKKKIALLKKEGIEFKNNKVIDFEEKLYRFKIF